MPTAPLRFESFFRLIWRWHFWVGLIASPTLLVVSITGGLFVFKDDLVDWDRSHLVFVSQLPNGKRPLDEQLAEVKRTYPDATVGLITLPAGNNRASMVQIKSPGSPLRIAYVDPHSCDVLGDAPLAHSPFWAGVLSLHRNLFAGYTGRILVELTTAWCGVLVVSGLYLWIPKKWRTAGVWWPRLRAHRYTVIRDLHTVPSVYLAPIAIILCMTGLFFSPIWSEVYSRTTGPAGSYPIAFITAPPATATPIDRSPIPVSAAMNAAYERFPNHRLMVIPPRKPTDPYAVTINGMYGSTAVGFLAMDRTTGEIVADNRYDDLPFLGKVRLWIYPLHVGTVGGMTTKVIAALTCLMLAVAAITGIAMWLIRRRKGDWGFPHRTETTRIPKWGGVLILATAIVLPTVAISLGLVLLGDWLYGKLTRTG